MTTVKEGPKVANIMVIARGSKLFDEIDSWLRNGFGYFLDGGSIIVYEDGTVEHNLGVNRRGAATVGTLGEQIKRKFGFKNLYLDSQKV